MHQHQQIRWIWIRRLPVVCQHSMPIHRFRPRNVWLWRSHSKHISFHDNNPFCSLSLSLSMPRLHCSLHANIVCVCWLLGTKRFIVSLAENVSNFTEKHLHYTIYRIRSFVCTMDDDCKERMASGMLFWADFWQLYMCSVIVRCTAGMTLHLEWLSFVKACTIQSNVQKHSCIVLPYMCVSSASPANWPYLLVQYSCILFHQ